MKKLTGLFKQLTPTSPSPSSSSVCIPGGGEIWRDEENPPNLVQVPFAHAPSLSPHHYHAMHARHQHKTVHFLPDAELTKADLKRTDHAATLKTAKCMSIEKAFTPNECLQLIENAEKEGFASVDWEYAKTYRECDRVVVKDANLAHLIWRRMLSVLTPEDFRGMRPFGFGNDGTWIPIGINECIRYTRYKSGHKFKPHRDGGFLLSNDIRSVFTVMVYLNDSFSGGDTNFFIKENLGLSKQFIFPPKTGTMLVFNHDMWHEGEVVTKGSKYILRTDIMFERIELSISHKQYLLDPDYVEAARLYNQSVKLQGEGDQEGSTACYLKALDLQAKHATIDFVPQRDSSVTYQIIRMVLPYLPAGSIMAIATVSRAWNYMAHDPSLWQELYYRRWHDKAARMDYDITRNWFVSFKNRMIADRNFTPNVNEILYFDVGAKNTKFGMSKPKTYKPTSYTTDLDPETFEFREHHFIHDKDGCKTYNGPYQIESVLQRITGHYWAVDSEIDSFHVGPEVTGKNNATSFGGNKEHKILRPFELAGKQTFDQNQYYTRRYSQQEPEIKMPVVQAGDPKMAYTESGKPKIEIFPALILAIVKWCIITSLVNHDRKEGSMGFWKDPAKYPIIVAEPQGVGSYASFVMRYICHILLKSPYVCIVHPAELALMGQGHRTGLVVSSGHMTTQIVPVWEGEVLVEKIVIFPVSGRDFEDSKEEAQQRCWKKDESIADVVHQVILSCTKEQQPMMWERVLLSGGGTYHFDERLEKELKQKMIKCRVIAPEDRIMDVVNGANVMCHLSNISERFESRDDFYREWYANALTVDNKKKNKK